MRCRSRALPFLTVAMIAISAFVRSYGWAAVGVMVVMAFSLRLALKGERFREQFDTAKLRLPVIGRVTRDYNAARLAGTLGNVCISQPRELFKR